MNNIKKIIIRIIAGLMPTTNLRRCVRNCMTVGFGKTHYRGKNNKLVYVDKNGKKHTVRRRLDVIYILMVRTIILKYTAH